MPCIYTFREGEAKQDLPLCNYNDLGLAILDKDQILMKVEWVRERDTKSYIQHSIEHAKTFYYLCYLQVSVINLTITYKQVKRRVVDKIPQQHTRATYLRQHQKQFVQASKTRTVPPVG